MSTQADHQTNAPADSGKTNKTPASQKQSSGWLVLAFFVIGLVASAISGWVGFPNLLYSEKSQPIDFNHQLHLNQVYEGCESCHYFRSDGSFAGTPDNSACADCHSYPMGLGEDEEKLANEYIGENKQVPWLSYSEQPDCVFFSHAAHVKGAGMECKTCHGDIGQSESLRTYQENRISGYSRDIWGYNIARLGKPKHGMRMKMNDCAGCHLEETGSKGACFQCHK
ncbi:MAG: menaquinone reductase multiheme cytochrome c subunit QrcA [Thermodesulfobacteriota bacterium]